MALIPDLVQVSKLETQFEIDSGCTQHVRYTFGNASRRKIRQEEQWRREKDIGCGGGGVIWLERCIQSGQEKNVRAVKKIRKEVDSSTYYRELEAMALFSHSKYEPCFVKFFGWYENSDSIFIAMEYLSHGDLHQHLGSPLAEREGQYIVLQILEGLQFMHDSGFVHRDLKPANILVQHKGPNWWVKIGDFGISKRASESWTRIGTPAFAAPEVFRSGRPGDSYTRAVDIWSLGVITFFILTGEILFKDSYRLDQYFEGSFEFPSSSLLANNISKQGHDFIKNSMAPKPENRSRVKECLQHSWLISIIEDLSPETPSTINTPKATMIQQSYSSPEPSASWSTLVPLTTYESDRSPAALAKEISQAVIAQSASETATQVERHTRMFLKGHSRSIHDVKFSPNGKLIASASSDQTIRLWDSATGTPRIDLRGHSAVVWHVAFSPNGKQVASASSDQSIKVWDSFTGSLLNTLRGHSDKVWGVTFSPDGKQIASASADSTIRFWNTFNRTPRGVLQGHSDGVWHVEFSPNAKQIASASRDKTIIVWDSITRRAIHILKGHTDVVAAVTFSPNGEMVASASFDKKIMLWDSMTGTLLNVLIGHFHAIRSLAFSPDGKQIASASMDKHVRLWDIATNTARILAPHSGHVLSVTFSPDGKQMASASTDTFITLWQSVTEAQTF